jgi:eukaryotic-like serine/threonine-protein kinase
LALTPGTRLGVYEVTALIGEGGMGQVYRATDTKLKRQVAIKILPPSLAADHDRLTRFQREAEVLASLNHPHVAAIYGLEESGDMTALVMELVEGDDLSQRIAKGAIPLNEALPIARQIADALEAAHEQGIIHRDLKPANIKVRSDGTVKVLDFGLAKVMDPARGSSPSRSMSPTLSLHATQAGIILGTAAYMSPEQARGKVVDKRADIWAFGCVLYEMLTGHAIFARATVTDTLAAIVERESDWTTLPAKTPMNVRRLLRRCLEKDPKRRCRDIGDVRIELDDELFAEPAGLPAIAPSRGPSRWKLVTLFSIALGIGAALTAIVFGVRAPGSPPRGVSAEIIVTQLTNLGGTESSPAISPDGRSFAFVSDHGGTSDIWLRQVSGGEPVRLTNDAAEEADLAFAPDGDSIYFTRTDGASRGVWRTGVLGGQPRKVLNDGWGSAPSPDGKSLAYVTGDGAVGFALAVTPLDGGGVRMLVEHLDGGTFRPAWSHDGRWIAYTAYALFGPVDVFIVETATGKQRRVAQLPLTTAVNDGGTPVWLPDNRHLVISYLPLPRQQAAGDLGILDIQDGSIERLTATVGDGFYAPRLSADGSRLIATRLHYLQEIWKVPLDSDPDTNGRSAVRLVEESAGPLWTFVSRDGRTALFNSPASGSRNLWTLPLDRRAMARQVTSVAGDAITHSALSPDGTHVAFASIASGHSDIWTQRVDGSDLRQLTNDETADSWPVWSPDGEWIVYRTFRAERSEAWRIRASGGPAEKLLDQGFRGDWIRQPGGAGTWIVTTGTRTGSGVRLIDVERRAIVWEQTVPGGGLSLPMFSQDGRSISAPFREDRTHDVVRIFDTATGASRIIARLPFHVVFRASWTDERRAVIVNRNDQVSHIVMFDHFWTEGRKR